jgi:hypothetical protein
MKKVLTPEMMERRRRTNKRILKYFILSIAVLWIIVLIIPSTPKVVKSERKVNIDSIMTLIKEDKLFEIKDIYYNPTDSSLNIAFTNKENVIKDGDYSTLYFNNAYHINTYLCFDGVYLYAYKKGLSLSKGDYKEYLTCESKRAARILDIIKKKYCYGNKCVPLIDYLKQSLNDPNSYESENLGIDWYKGNSFIITNSFRSKNAFGALMLNKCTATIDINGNVSDFKLDN